MSNKKYDRAMIEGVLDRRAGKGVMQNRYSFLTRGKFPTYEKLENGMHFAWLRGYEFEKKHPRGVMFEYIELP